MSTAALILIGLVPALIAVHMARPRYRRRALSAWRFLADLPGPERRRSAFALSRPQLGLRFWLQLAVLLLALAAVLLPGLEIAGGREARLGVWLLVDTSYSMTTREGDGTRLDSARGRARAAIARTFEPDQGVACLRLSSFDLEVRDLATSSSAPVLVEAVERLAARPAGTDLRLARRALTDAAGPDCPITHLVVVSDRPAPDFGHAEPEPESGADRRLVWLDVGGPTVNHGLADIAAMRDPFSGRIETVTVAAESRGGSPEHPPVIMVRGPDGAVMETRPVPQSGTGLAVRFTPAGAGDHVVTLAPGGAYDGDDRAVLTIPDAAPLRVDWRLPGRDLPDRLGWDRADPQAAALRVLADADANAAGALAADGPPVLVVGPGYGMGEPAPVGLFVDHPIRDLVNLDLLEQTAPAPAALSGDWTAVVADAGGRIWIAARERPRAVRIPGLPAGGDGTADRLAATVFFNAVHWLLRGQAGSFEPSLTTPDGTAIREFDGEGDVSGPARSLGSLDDIVPVPGDAEKAPLWPWLVLAAALVFATERILSLRRIAESRVLRRGVILGASGLAAALLAGAGLNPMVPGSADAPGRFVAIAVDMSDSAARSGLHAAASELAGWVRSVVAARPPGGELWTGALLAIADGSAVISGPVSLDQLAGRLEGLDRFGGPPGGETDIAAGLRAAAGLAARSGQPGSVVLLSDGLETRGDAVQSAEVLGRRGIPVFPFPLESRAPALGLVAADLPAVARSGAETTVRAVLGNPGAEPARFGLEWHANVGSLPDAVADRELAPGRAAAWRQSTRFGEEGLAYGTLSLWTADGRVRSRRLFTLVQSPVRVLAIGPADWARALPADRFAVTAIPPDGISAPATYDVVVINAVPADALAAPVREGLALAVRGGTGLLLLNGDHPYPDTHPSVIMSYEETGLGPLLPVTGEARLVRDEPPPRDVILAIDSSGSMDGWKLERAREIALAIIDRLSWRDTARILTFRTGVEEILPQTAMDAIGRERARDRLSRVVAGGGTDPGEALRLVARTAGARCGLFFISDGAFGSGWRPPGCLTTVFGVGRSLDAMNPELFALGDVHPVGRDFAAGSIRLEFFEPAPRETYFEPGRFMPEPVGPPLPEVPWPPEPLTGSALVHVRGEARAFVMRPWPYVPVLAFREDAAARVGVLGTALPEGWPDRPRTAAAIEAWVSRLVRWPDRDRYIFDMDDQGRELAVRLVLGDGAAAGEPVTRIAASVRLEDGMRLALPLEPDPSLWGSFTGRLALPPGETGRSGILELREQGPGAIHGTRQIPIHLPPRLDPSHRKAGGEAWAYGVDLDLLGRIAGISGGAVAPAPDMFAAMQGSLEPPDRPLFSWLLAAAGFSYLAAIAVQRTSA